MTDFGTIVTGTFDDVAGSLMAFLAISSKDARRAGQVTATGHLGGTAIIASTAVGAPGSTILLFDSYSYQNIGFAITDSTGAFSFGPLEVGASFFFAAALPSPDDPTSYNGLIFTKLTAVS